MKNIFCNFTGPLPQVVALPGFSIGLRMFHRVLRVRLPALKKYCVLAGFAFSTAAVFGQNPNSIIYSKHNLSISGPGTVRSSTESEICIFCHTPHNATGDGPLWNHEMSAAAYTPYSSSTLKAAVGQPTGASKLCLGCHDGTVALGMVGSRSAPIPMQSGAATMPSGQTRLGTDLSAHHPVSFAYSASLATSQGELRDPSTLVHDVRLDRNGELQCTSCHDPHNNQFGSFLVVDNNASALCLNCHTPNQWAASAHATSTATWNGVGPDPWPHTSGTTVAANACENCHRPHAAENRLRLLNFAPAEQNCYVCHSGTVAAKNIAAEFNKLSVHPVSLTSGVHDPAEDAINAPHHAACEDCHNPHAAKSTTGTALAVAGSLAGVHGVNASGAVVSQLQFEYELCFRCHGTSSGNNSTTWVQRQFVQTNTRLEFNPGTVSFHPVEVIGKNPLVPSLILPLTVSSLTKCSDCHNNNQGPGNGGTGPKGPHGSSFAPLLERNLQLTDGIGYNQSSFALCYKCHSSSVVDSEQTSSWKYHKKHIEEFRAACTTCHDSHAANQPHLINFNTTYVLPLNGVLQYTSTGLNHGTCTLTCHDGSGQNKPHNAKSY